MVRIPGGRYWAGRHAPGGNPEEHPSFESRVHDFCLDRTEVTTEAYARCEQAGKCTSAVRGRITCNAGRKDRQDHPINCVTWEQAEAFCRADGRRLPSELEWEYAARGGSQYRKYSWGDAPPDGHACWKRNRSCPVASYPAGAFGLFDMSGNVWEWTRDPFGAYPWPAQEAPWRVYRGGSWSRRFVKWMSLTLRNRFAPDKYGAHLGFRCAVLPQGAECPYGAGEAGSCRHGVEDVRCLPGQTFNGQRCAAAGAPLCPEGSEPIPGHGCVARSGAPAEHHAEVAASSVASARSPQFDADCERFAKGRPLAYRLSGGTHAQRNAVGHNRGCKNRDVGVGWNSACCPGP